MGATAVLGRWSIAPVVVLVALGAVAPVAHGLVVSPGGTSAVEDAASYATGPASCIIPLPASGVHGQLTIDGGPLPSNAAGDIVLNYTYTLAYRSMYEPNATQVGVGCIVVHGNTTTEPNGSFAFDPVSLPLNCTQTAGGEICTEYSNPYAPAEVELAAGPPPGYAVSVAGWDASIAIALDYEFESVTVTPGGPTVTTSVGAPTTFTASARAANGSVSPLSPTFSWVVAGTGWSFDGAAAGPSIALTAVAGASVATLTVRANASAQGTALAPVSATVDVVAVSTAIETGEANRTALDAGGAVDVRLTAVGAAGFDYAAVVEPGLGLAEVAIPCSAGPPDEGTVVVDCATNVTYPSAGTAQPTANVTNGYSTADWRFPDVVVSAPPELEVAPAAPVGYALDPVAITVTAANGSGALPYARACLEAGSAPAACDASAGPSWTFAPTFASPGGYTASAWAVDADGANASISFPVEIVPSLGVSPIGPSGVNVTVNAPVELHATVSGGVSPLRYWWNASGAAGPLLDGDLASDGALSVTVIPTDPGPLVVTLTVVDSLGTVLASDLLITVGPAAAERVAPVTAAPAGPVTVGAPVPLAWGAFDVAGRPDTSFEAAAELELTTGAGAPEAWVNASGVGPLDPLGEGTYGVPASAWVDGVLTVMVTVGTAADVAVGLSGAALPGTVAPMNLSVEPDRAHVRLYAPTVVHAGGRANDTLWRVEDRYGNPVPGALLTVGLSFGGERTDAVVAAVDLAGGGSGVWVNYSAPTGGVGVVTVVDGAGDVVLGPLTVPAVPVGSEPDPTVDALAAIAPVGIAGIATLAVVRHRRRARAPPPVEDELRHLAEGRARAVELIGRAGAVDLAGLEAAWDPPPAPPALADWLASLVADGTIRATVGDDGRPRFCLAESPREAPRVTFDRDELDRSLRRRDEELRREDGDRPD